MLQAPRAPDIPDIERFNLTQVNNLLQLADRLMEPGCPYLHKVGCHEPALLYFLQELNDYLKYHPSQFEVLMLQTNLVLKRIRETSALQCEIDHVWARLIKYVFMSGNILDLNDIRMNCCRSIYLTQLKKILEEGLSLTINTQTNKPLFSFDKLNRPDAQMSFFEFMGQLLKSGFEANVRAIHDFLYLAKKVAKSPGSGMNVEQIATTIAPCLLKMLFAEKVLCPVESPEQETPQKKKESQFMSVLLTCLLRTNRFDMPFSPVPYKDYNQAAFDGLYQNILPAITDPFCLVECATSTSKLSELLKKMQVKDKNVTPMAIQIPLELRAALAMKNDEPVVRAASSDKLLSRVPRSRQLKQHVGAELLVPQNALVFSDLSASSTPAPANPAPQQSAEEPEKKPSVQLQ